MRRVLLYTVLVVFVGACGLGEALTDYGESVVLKPADVVGTWQSGASRTITFAEDGRFSAADLPREAFASMVPDGFDPARDRLDGSGTWEIETVREAASGVTMRFEEFGGRQTQGDGPELTAKRREGVVYLVYYYVGDDGNSWTAYHKP
ncbi:hypothetical protein ACTMTJ_14460 [Phytohabitans sp. LJ34]|uniref:hypothetical protein n=1 Tax=Phytohabitans sp. LJ34 TaxID=3452217 RepID=UPI003F89BFD1